MEMKKRGRTAKHYMQAFTRRNCAAVADKM
jgi:hypothetical protein